MSEIIERLGSAREVDIITTSGGREYATIIWVAYAEGSIYARSFRGDEGKWYQRVVAEPNVKLRLGQHSADFVAVVATDPHSVAICSESFREKYSGSSLDAMLLPEILHTTLRFDPITTESAR